MQTGNTPTGVGKTILLSTGKKVDKKHPHGRGEDPCSCNMRTKCGETPPRAWGRPQASSDVSRRAGNTPTGVGKTRSASRKRSSSRKHPHGRGEDHSRISYPSVSPETPPRAWGRRIMALSLCLLAGNTPTGVGKTPRMWRRKVKEEKHPHGRGEDVLSTSEAPNRLGSGLIISIRFKKE